MFFIWSTSLSVWWFYFTPYFDKITYDIFTKCCNILSSFLIFPGFRVFIHKKRKILSFFYEKGLHKKWIIVYNVEVRVSAGTYGRKNRMLWRRIEVVVTSRTRNRVGHFASTRQIFLINRCFRVIITFGNQRILRFFYALHLTGILRVRGIN